MFKNFIRFSIHCLQFVLANIHIRKQTIKFSNESQFIVVVSPWNFSVTPLYQIKLYILLCKNNSKTKIIFDDINYNLIYFFNIIVLKIVLSFLKIKYYSITSFPDSDTLLHYKFKQLFTNSIYENVSANFKGDFYSKESIQFQKNFSRSLFKNYLKIIKLLEDYRQSTLIIPGGSLGSSGLIVEFAKILNVNFFTFDSGFSIVSFCKNGVTSKNENISKNSVDLLKYIFLKKNKNLIKEAKALIEARKSSNFELSFQHLNPSGKVSIDNDYFVLFLNIIWDGASFTNDYNNNNYYNGIINFIFQFVHNTDKHLIIRQHPDERKWWGKSKIDYNIIVYKLFPSFKERISVIKAEDKVNSYDLLEFSSGVVVWSSTIGLESLLLNKPTIYLSKNFLFEPNAFCTNVVSDLTTLLEFFNCPNNFIIKDNERESIASIYLLTQRYTWLKTSFTPQNSDFKVWVNESDEKLTSDIQVNIIFNSILNNISLTDNYLLTL